MGYSRWFLLLGITANCVFFGLSSACEMFERCVYDDIFVKNNYNKNVRPISNASEIISVEVQFTLLGLQAIYEVDGGMEVQGFFNVKWRDRTLVWNPRDYGGTQSIVVPATEVWLPDLALSNSDNKFYEETFKVDFRVSIHYTGEMIWNFGGTLNTNCDIALSKYPFDTQDCDIVLESWVHNKDKVDMEFSLLGGINLDYLEDNLLWKLSGNRTDTSSILKYRQSYRALIFTLSWIRKPMYYYLTILGPSVVLMFISLGLFWLPADCGEKTGLGITVLLAFSVFQVIVMESTPENSDVISELTQYVLSVTILSALALLTSTLVIYIRNRDSYKPPKLLTYICYRILARIMCMDVPPKEKKEFRREVIHLRPNPSYWSSHLPIGMRYYSTNNMTVKSYRKKHKTASSISNVMSSNTLTNDQEDEEFDRFIEKTSVEVKQILAFVTEIWQNKEEDEESDLIEEEWNKLGRIIDRFMFWVTLVAYIFAIMYIFIKSRLF